MAWSCLCRADLAYSREVISGMHVTLEEPRISPNGHSVIGEKGSKKCMGNQMYGKSPKKKTYLKRVT
jgi:hypothetical protein